MNVAAKTHGQKASIKRGDVENRCNTRNVGTLIPMRLDVLYMYIHHMMKMMNRIWRSVGEYIWDSQDI